MERDARAHRVADPPARDDRGERPPGRRDPADRQPPAAASQRRPGAGADDPGSFARDLNPDPEAGLNRGPRADAAAQQTAHDLKDVHQTWSGLSDADLKQIPVLAEGTRLEQGATYLDLNDPQRGEIRALGTMEAGPNNRYVAKKAVDYQLWNALIGVDNPERLGTGDDR